MVTVSDLAVETYYANVTIPSMHEGACEFGPVCEVEPTHLVCMKCFIAEGR